MTTFLGKIFPSFFCKKERIVRIIYSTQNINPKTKKLKANFVKFRWGSKSLKYELSCNRFEIDSLENCRSRGLENANPDPKYKRNFYGYGCTSVAIIKGDNGYFLNYTPINPNNLSHCDIYDEELQNIVDGEAGQAITNYRREQFVQNWHAYEDSNLLVKADIIPHR